jgi:hypothetical protein
MPGATHRTSRPAGARDRGVSSNVSYVLTLTIMTLLLTGLALSSGAVIDDERSRVIRAQLEVLGERLASDLTSADQLARRTGTDTTMRTTSDLPDQVVSRSYSISIRSAGAGSSNIYEIDMIAGTVETTVEVYSLTDIETGSTPGGPVEIVYTGSELEVNGA